MGRLTSSFVVGCALVGIALIGEVRGQGQPADQLTIAFDVSIAPTFLDPAETSGIGTPFVFLYALHDALTKPRRDLGHRHPLRIPLCPARRAD